LEDFYTVQAYISGPKIALLGKTEISFLFSFLPIFKMVMLCDGHLQVYIPVYAVQRFRHCLVRKKSFYAEEILRAPGINPCKEILELAALDHM